MPETLPTAQDQLMLELVNRARANPQAEADRLLGGNLNEGLAPGTISTVAKQPLAFNLNLNAAANGHSQWMLDNDIFSHTGANGSSPGTRMANAGYPFTGAWGRGENLAWNGTTGTPDFTQFVIDNHNNLFIDDGVTGRGHRLNLMNVSYREVGISSLQGLFTTSSGNTYNAVMSTQDFAYSSNRGPFLTGVVYTDAVTNDNFYTVGEGLGSVTVTASNSSNTVSTTTWGSGGYTLAVPTGTYNVTFSADFNNDGQTDTVTQSVTIGSDNVKVDLATDTINFAPIPTNGNDTLSGGAGNDSINALGGNDLVTGGDGDDTLLGAGGNDSLDGESGNDRLTGGSGNDVLTGGEGNDILSDTEGNDSLDGESGNDRLTGGSGNDVLTGGEGNDILSDTEGNDSLTGGAGNDNLTGGTGNDILIGAGSGSSGVGERDTLRGNDGNDVFVLGNSTQAYYLGNSTTDRATIADFTLGTDQIQLYGSATAYTLSVVSGSTQIRYSGDLVAIVSNVTSLNLNDSSAFSYI
jgi:serralysin